MMVCFFCLVSVFRAKMTRALNYMSPYLLQEGDEQNYHKPK